MYVRHEIVHNKRVVEGLKGKGAIFVEELDEVPEGAITVFSAHGVAAHVAEEAQRRNLPVMDATCRPRCRVSTGFLAGTRRSATACTSRA